MGVAAQQLRLKGADCASRINIMTKPCWEDASLLAQQKWLADAAFVRVPVRPAEIVAVLEARHIVLPNACSEDCSGRIMYDECALASYIHHISGLCPEEGYAETVPTSELLRNALVTRAKI